MPYRRIRAVAYADLTGPAKAVLLAVGICADKHTFRTFAKVDTLAAIAGVSRRTAQRAISQLEEEGWIRLHRRATQHKPAVWEIDILKCEASDINGYTGSGVTESPLEDRESPLAVTESPLTLLSVVQGGQSDTPEMPKRLPDESVTEWMVRVADAREA